MEQLATASGVSRGTLSRIETNALSTSLSNAVAIASALGSDLSDLLAPTPSTLVRAGQGQTYTDPDGVQRTALARPAPGVELVEFRIPAGVETTTFPAHLERTTETVHVLAGTLTYRLADQEHELHPGDTLTTRADAPHQLVNTSTHDCIAHIIITSPR